MFKRSGSSKPDAVWRFVQGRQRSAGSFKVASDRFVENKEMTGNRADAKDASTFSIFAAYHPSDPWFGPSSVYSAAPRDNYPSPSFGHLRALVALVSSGASVKPSVSCELKGVHHGMIR